MMRVGWSVIKTPTVMVKYTSEVVCVSMFEIYTLCVKVINANGALSPFTKKAKKAASKSVARFLLMKGDNNKEITVNIALGDYGIGLTVRSKHYEGGLESMVKELDEEVFKAFKVLDAELERA